MSSRTTRAEPRRSWLRIAIVFAAAAAAAAGAWYLFGRPAAPSAVGLGAVATATPPAIAGARSDPSAAPAGSDATVASTGTAGSLDGTWTVDTSIGSFDDFSSSFVGYRVQEELAGVGAATAVGRTPDVTGTLNLDGSAITAVEVEADLTTLRSDSDMRDGQLGRQGLETDQFPTATFVLAEPIDLGAVPVDGGTISVTGVGDLTLHGVTKRVEMPLEARLSDNVVTVVGSLPIAFSDYGMTAPESMRVLSIDENGVMELQLHFSRA
jgi:polyisoprenoid-binding protein YceI